VKIGQIVFVAATFGRALASFVGIELWSTVDELVAALRQWGFTVDGRPSKTVSDALRWEMEHDRVRRIGRGLYRAGGMPIGTEYRIIRRVSFLREEATPEDAGRGGRATRGRARRVRVLDEGSRPVHETAPRGDVRDA
jgi:hypothetical protein